MDRIQQCPVSHAVLTRFFGRWQIGQNTFRQVTTRKSVRQICAPYIIKNYDIADHSLSAFPGYPIPWIYPISKSRHIRIACAMRVVLFLLPFGLLRIA